MHLGHAPSVRAEGRPGSSSTSDRGADPGADDQGAAQEAAQVLTDVFAEVLGAEAFGPLDDFFA
ncbi:hypothetical protein, partial [Streptomyces somaliensis]